MTVTVQELRKSYGDRTVVDGLSFRVEEGEIFGILGPNGAGKTTAVECLEGLRTPDSGVMRVAGLDPVRQQRELTRMLGVQLQQSRLQPKLTVAEALTLYSSFYPQAADRGELIDRLELGELLHRRFHNLSGGQQQRLFIALALIGRPRIVVFDELTTALDPRARRETWALVEDIRRSGVTVLLVTHFMEEAQQLCDRIAVLDRGRLVAVDTPSGLIRRSAAPTVISFRPARELPSERLYSLPGATSVEQRGERMVVHGTDATVNAVITLLAGSGITVSELRITDATLDQAFLDLTGTAEGGV